MIIVKPLKVDNLIFWIISHSLTIKFITFLVGAIASGRVIFSLIPSTPGFYNSFFVFEICAFVIGVGFLFYFRSLDKIAET